MLASTSPSEATYDFTSDGNAIYHSGRAVAVESSV
jgi:hypothetical protein